MNAPVESMIVTVIDRTTQKALDVEIAASLHARAIAQLLGTPALFGYGDVPHALYSTQLGRALQPGESLFEAGIWEGSELWAIPYA